MEVQSSSDGNMCCTPAGEEENPFVAMTTPCAYVGMASVKSLSLTAIFFAFLSKGQILALRLSHAMSLESGNNRNSPLLVG